MTHSMNQHTPLAGNQTKQADREGGESKKDHKHQPSITHLDMLFTWNSLLWNNTPADYKQQHVNQIYQFTNYRLTVFCSRGFYAAQTRVCWHEYPWLISVKFLINLLNMTAKHQQIKTFRTTRTRATSAFKSSKVGIYNIENIKILKAKRLFQNSALLLQQSFTTVLFSWMFLEVWLHQRNGCLELAVLFNGNNK